MFYSSNEVPSVASEEFNLNFKLFDINWEQHDHDHNPRIGMNKGKNNEDRKVSMHDLDQKCRIMMPMCFFFVDN